MDGALAARDTLLSHIESVVLARQQQPTQDALGLLVQSQDEDGNRLSVGELKVQALLLLFAGHETTTSLVFVPVFGAGSTSRYSSGQPERNRHKLE